MRDLKISRLSLGHPTAVGRIDREHGLFIYDEGYLAAPNAIALSNSLPLRSGPFSEGEFRPYFEGLLAEGVSCQALIAQLQIPENDYLSLLAAFMRPRWRLWTLACLWSPCDVLIDACAARDATSALRGYTKRIWRSLLALIASVNMRSYQGEA